MGMFLPWKHIRECQYTAKHDDWQGLSITELEFRYAKEEARIPCLIFVAKRGNILAPGIR